MVSISQRKTDMMTKTFLVKIPYYYWESFVVEAKSKEKAIALVLDDDQKYAIGDEEQGGILEDFLIKVEEME